jgi:hypothetical protein
MSFALLYTRPVVSSTIALGMMGIIQIAIIIEEPFSILPLKQITEGIEKSTLEHEEYNAWEQENRPQKRSISTKLYEDYLSEDYASQEYLEAMSIDTVIRHQTLNQPVSKGGTARRPAQQPPATITQPQQASAVAPPSAPAMQQQQFTAPAPAPQTYYPEPATPDPSPLVQPSQPEQFYYQSSTFSGAETSNFSPVDNNDNSSDDDSNLSPMERLEKMKLGVLSDINESLRNCNDNNDSNS